jgi:TolA-binding protein
MAKLLNALILILLFSSLSAQNNDNDNQIAIQYFNNREYEKALIYLKKIYEDSRTKENLDLYIKCLIELKDLETAGKVLKKEIKRNPSETGLYVDLGYIYKLQGETNSSHDQFEKAIKNLIPELTQIISLANNFISKQEFDFAEKTYLQGKKLMYDSYDFNFELASIYLLQRNYVKMINEYLDILDKQPNMLVSVQNILQQFIFSELDTNQNILLKQNILKKIRTSPDNIIYYNLLIWLYIQERDFNNAIIQAKALDKRNKESGERLIYIGNLATSNLFYNSAVEAYKYVIDKGENSIFYVEAQSQYLNTLYKKVISEKGNSKNDIIELENQYNTILNKLGENKNTFLIVINLSDILAFHIDKPETAVEKLKKMLENKDLSKDQVNECKLKLGDILLFMGEVWEAVLYYAQVQYANENNPVGFEAKFRVAKIAFYTGDLKWAQAQLSVLKASTTKLIDNDAFQISYLIQENTVDDSDGTAIKMLAKAEYLVFQNKDSIALLVLDTIYSKYNANAIIPVILYKKSVIMKKSGKYSAASDFLEDIYKMYPDDVLADDALFDLGELYELNLNDKNKAKEYYSELFNKFPGSVFSAEAKARFRILRGDKIKNIQ